MQAMSRRYQSAVAQKLDRHCVTVVRIRMNEYHVFEREHGTRIAVVRSMVNRKGKKVYSAKTLHDQLIRKGFTSLSGAVNRVLASV